MALHGTIAPTDFGWYQTMAARRYWEEVNFWTPSARTTFRAEEFSPFLFKLKAPHRVIAGFGYFARFSRLPDWLVWQCFGEANGCGSFEDLHQRIETIRHRIGYVATTAVVEIGCIVVVNAVFFSREQWIPQPKDWPDRNLRPMRYDLEIGEGARVWQECMSRVGVGPSPAGVRSIAVAATETGERYGSPYVTRPRLGQGAFRVAVTDAYSRACAVTGEHSLPALEAAHIKPFAKDGPHEVRNGLCLRADVHRLFELGYLTVTTDYRLEVSSRLKADFQNGRSYYPLHGSTIALPDQQVERPTADVISWHNQNKFLG